MTCRYLIFLAFLSAPMLAQAWWNTDWAYRKSISIPTTPTGANIPVEVDQLPVLIRLHTGNFGYFLDIAEDARDLRFMAADDKTPLPFHVEKFDPINEMALIWVKIPKLLANSDANSLWMYYGNPNAVSAADPAATYDADQALVYHFDSKQPMPADSTAYGNQPSAWTAEVVADSLIGAGARFNGSALLRIADKPSLQTDPAKGWTLGFWFRVDALPSAEQGEQTLLVRKSDANALTLSLTHTGLVARLTVGEQTQATSPAGFVPGSWHHVSLVLTNAAVQLFVDGSLAQQLAAAVPALGGDIFVGGGEDAAAPGFNGDIDELEIASVARSASWLAATVKSQSPGTTMLVYGEDADQGKAGGGESYFLTTLHNVTLDGWVVIVVLALMGAISWVVMFNKGIVISRVRRDNRAFDKKFTHLSKGHLEDLDAAAPAEASDESPLLTALAGKHDHFQSSTIYRVYHAGVQEVHHRLTRSVGARAAGTLSPQAIGAIRATMDSVMTRENQKLNGQMVLLTIAISGGPFLGLLGTVVGVMITFAAIAASGDVNVNSIAPGIAAALVATVAGLVVAIPALFGYNYLGTRIREVQSDMHVFADEFVAKIAEEYS